MNGRGRGGHDNMPIRGGNPNRGRGRGGRGGYTVVDNSDPMENVVRNNLSFRPQNMSAVPPPAILNNEFRGRGRGRGRGEGRGGRGAGRGGPNGASRGRGGAVNGDSS
jgi:5'-3' exoribonuclease 1